MLLNPAACCCPCPCISSVPAASRRRPDRDIGTPIYMLTELSSCRCLSPPSWQGHWSRQHRPPPGQRARPLHPGPPATRWEGAGAATRATQPRTPAPAWWHCRTYSCTPCSSSNHCGQLHERASPPPPPRPLAGDDSDEEAERDEGEVRLRSRPRCSLTAATAVFSSPPISCPRSCQLSVACHAASDASNV